MGIPGLTTFIQNRSHIYLDDYELHDTNLVIDGNAIACQLYKWHCKANDCFGGDYDKYATTIENFFQILSDCNVTSYIVFDGGYESRKIATIMSRMKNSIKSAKLLSSSTEGSVSVFPLFLRETFQDIVLKLNIKCVRCDFEGDTETANIARTLNCPVLSYDSDFYIFDVLYIPFSTFEMCTRKKKKTQWNQSYNYVSCKIYRIEKFLKSFGGLDKRNLPILAVLLGNDYVKRSLFSEFYNNLKMQKCHGNQSDQQKRIKSVMVWLQNESIESAIQKVLSRYKCKRRKLIADKIKNAIIGYNCTDSIYLKYLQIPPVYSKEPREKCLDMGYLDNINFKNENGANEDVNSDEDSRVSASEEETIPINDEASFSVSELNLAPIFLEKFRRCLYPQSFMDILIQNKYYCIPQVENDALECSHAVSIDIVSAIQSVLTNCTDNLICISRGSNGNVQRQQLPHCIINMPSLTEIQNMELSSRRNLLMQVLKIEVDFKNCLSLFPESWHLFLLSLKYFVDKSEVTWSILYALIINKIFLCYVDKCVGVCRTQKALEKKIKSYQIPIDNNEKTNYPVKFVITEALDSINYNDSLACLEKLFPNFHIYAKMRVSNRLYNRNVVHFMAQFQSCFLHIKYLNALLNFPFSSSIMSENFNGTFIYNLAVNFMKRPNLDNYITLLLQGCPTILNSVELIVNKLKECLNNVLKDVSSKRRKKKKKTKERDTADNEQDCSDEESAFDPNNKFSLLTLSQNDC